MKQSFNFAKIVSNIDDIPKRLALLASNAIKELLSHKHLYQSVTLDLKFLDEAAEAQYKAAIRHAMAPSLTQKKPNTAQPQNIRASLEGYCHLQWFLFLPGQTAPPLACRTAGGLEPPIVQLPTIKTVCSNQGCGDRGPFNPVGQVTGDSGGVASHQTFFVTYQCQNCKGPNVQFLIRRLGAKVTLCGRDPFEEIQVPQVIPKEQAKYLRDALIAHNSGQTLAGIFSMRVFVEQFWKSIETVAREVEGKIRPTGDDLGSAYKATLPNSFKERFPTLSEVYELLSDAMHAARADSELFLECYGKVIEHFEARRLFKILPSSVR
jgi:hypothetical protein